MLGKFTGCASWASTPHSPSYQPYSPDSPWQPCQKIPQKLPLSCPRSPASSPSAPHSRHWASPRPGSRRKGELSRFRWLRWRTLSGSGDGAATGSRCSSCGRRSRRGSSCRTARGIFCLPSGLLRFRCFLAPRGIISSSVSSNFLSTRPVSCTICHSDTSRNWQAAQNNGFQVPPAV